MLTQSLELIDIMFWSRRPQKCPLRNCGRWSAFWIPAVDNTLLSVQEGQVEICSRPARALASSSVPWVMYSHKAAGRLNISCRYFLWNQIFLFSRVSCLSPDILENRTNIFLPYTSQAIFRFLLPSSHQTVHVHRLAKRNYLLVFG